MRGLKSWTALGAALTLLASLPASAQSARDSGGASAQLMQQIQQLGSERTTLQAENARMKKELAEITKERDSLRAARTASDRRVAASEDTNARTAQALDSTEKELERQKERMQELVAKLRETAETLRDVETEKATFQQSLVTRDAEIKACKDRNDGLYKLNDEVLTRLEKDGVWARVTRSEPFTQLKRVQLENLVDEYRYGADGLREKPIATGSEAAAPAANR